MAELGPSAVGPSGEPSGPSAARPRPAEGLSAARFALIKAYAAINPELRRELPYVGIELPDDIDPYEWLRAVAGSREVPGRPALHRLQLAFATMAVVASPRAPAKDDLHNELRPIGQALVTPEREEPGGADEIVEAMIQAARSEADDRQRWTEVVTAVGAQLHPDLSKIKTAWCQSELRSVDGEFVSRVETRLVVDEPKGLDRLALAVIPDNWSLCNDFFCSLTRRPDRDASCPFTTGGNLTTTATNWRGVYEERVGSCPAGWFPDTYLLFTWNLSDRQIILRYELTPRLPGDRTVLRIDQGYLQVDRIGDEYQVATVKYLLFDDRFIPGGGQTLGQSACQLGWLDYSINQFTVCADNQPPPSPGPGGKGGIDADLQEVLDRCEANLVESASETDAQVREIARRIRAGDYGLDDGVADAGRIVARAIRDGARSVHGQIDFARSYLDLVDALTRRRTNQP